MRTRQIHFLKDIEEGKELASTGTGAKLSALILTGFLLVPVVDNAVANDRVNLIESFAAVTQVADKNLQSTAVKIAHKKVLSTHIQMNLDNAEFSTSDSNLEQYVSQHKIHIPGAGLIKPHFSKFNLPSDAYVTVSNAHGSETYRYGINHKDGYTYDSGQGDDGKLNFSSMSITGDTAIIKLYIGDINNWRDDHGIIIDSYLEGYSSERIQELLVSGDSTCGSLQRKDAVCYESSHPTEFAQSGAVAKFFTGSGSVCTAWRVGDDNRMMTNNHCQNSNAGIRASESWFNYLRSTCNGSRNEPGIVKVSGASILTTHDVLDFTLYTVNNFASLDPFGNLGLDVRVPDAQEEIYIPQHGHGFPRELAIESDQNVGNVCRVDAPTVNGNGANTDVGYFCDTIGGSSGSPVLTRDKHKVIALHHLGGCLNKGAQIVKIWPRISSFFPAGIPAGSGGGNGNRTPVVNAGSDQFVKFDDIANLQGTVTDDGLPNPPSVVTSIWSQVSGPGIVTFNNINAAATTAQFSELGVYVLRLSADDTELTGSDDLTITVNNSGSSLPLISVEATDALASEAGLDPATLTFTRTDDTTSTLTLRYTVSGTATAGPDYRKKSGTVKIKPGQSSRSIEIIPVNDKRVEGDETVIVTLSSNAAYEIGASNTATVTILDDDAGGGGNLPVVTVDATDAAASEAGLDPATLTFSRTGITTSTLTLNYTVSGTATAGSDYQKKTGVVKIKPGQASRSIDIKPINDSKVESDETVVLTLTANAAYEIGASGDATVTISDDDTGGGSNLPVVTISFVKDAQEAGRKNGRVRLERTGKTNLGLTVHYSVAGTAQSGTDYKALTGSKRFKARKNRVTFDIAPINDTLVEGLESVILTVQPDAAYQVGAADSATVNIIDND